MKKIIMAFAGENFSEGAFEFARRLNDIQPVLLTGVFVPETEMASIWGYAGGISGLTLPLIGMDDTEAVYSCIARFESSCLANGIEYRVHNDHNSFSFDELQQESTFADLLILGNEMFYKGSGNSPNDYHEGVLNSMKCPVLVVPKAFEFPETIVLAYDGSDNSVFAIKQFSYLFPELSTLPTVMLYASNDDTQQFPDEIRIEELTARHFSDLTLYKMDVDPGTYLNTWVVGKGSVMLVCGAYGRSGLSLLFKKSFVRDIIASESLPVFIDHR